MDKQQKKNIQLLSLLLVLLAFTTAAILYTPGKPEGSSIKKDRFSIENPQEAISRVELKGAQIQNTLVKQNGQWVVNNTFPMDRGMQQVFMALMGRVEVQRPITGALLEEARQTLQDTGIHVQIYGQNELVEEFIAGGDPLTVTSYFMQDNEVFTVHLPGYQSYVAGMFEVNENDWRERTILNLPWQEFEKVVLATPDNDSLVFQYDNEAFRLNGMAYDTAKVMQYVSSLSYLYVDKYVNEDDSLLAAYQSTEPLAQLKIEGLDPNKAAHLSLYPQRNPDARWMVGRLANGQWVLLEAKRAASYIQNKAYFSK